MPKAKKVKKVKKARKANAAFMKPLKVSDELALDVGKGPLPRTQVVKLSVYQETQTSGS